VKTVKIDNYYEFMDENIHKKEKLEIENKIVDDPKILVSLTKCPITGSDLEVTEEGLKVAVLIS
jgi:hypothetical protein